MGRLALVVMALHSVATAEPYADVHGGAGFMVHDNPGETYEDRITGFIANVGAVFGWRVAPNLVVGAGFDYAPFVNAFQAREGEGNEDRRLGYLHQASFHAMVVVGRQHHPARLSLTFGGGGIFGTLEEYRPVRRGPLFGIAFRWNLTDHLGPELRFIGSPYLESDTQAIGSSLGIGFEWQ